LQPDEINYLTDEKNQLVIYLFLLVFKSLQTGDKSLSTVNKSYSTVNKSFSTVNKSLSTVNKSFSADKKAIQLLLKVVLLNKFKFNK
jgi:hypothetical protein